MIRSSGFGFLYGLGAVFVFGLFLKTFIALNVSPSLPEWGWWRWPFVSATASDYRLGDKVEFVTPFDTGPINSVKIIAGLPGESVTIDDARNVFVGARLIGKAEARTGAGEVLIPIAEGIIPQGHFFMAATHPRSFDSRYTKFGLVPVSAITARAYPLPPIPLLGLDKPLFTEQDWQEMMKEARQ